jgi:hypothetical protein
MKIIHHAIVISVGQDIGGEWTMCVSDFTILASYGDNDDGKGGGIGGIGKIGGSGSSGGSAGGGED